MRIYRNPVEQNKPHRGQTTDCAYPQRLTTRFCRRKTDPKYELTINQMAVNQNPVLSRAPPTPCYIPLCRGLLLRTFVANAWRWYALQQNLVAKVLVASRGISVRNLCRGMAAEACYKPSVFDSQPDGCGAVQREIETVQRPSCHP